LARPHQKVKSSPTASLLSTARSLLRLYPIQTARHGKISTSRLSRLTSRPLFTANIPSLQAPKPPTQAKRPTARSKALARLKDPLLPRKLHREGNAVTDSFADTKRDKRQIRRSAFVSRIAKTTPGRTGSGALKRRRPNKKLVATLESLGDALGEIERDELGDEGEAQAGHQAGKTRHRSLRSRPGALKRKEKVVRGEMERFSRSLAQLATLPGGDSAAGEKGKQVEASGEVDQVAGTMETETAGGAAPTSSTSNRWAALRGFISATMEQNPAFVGK